MDAIVNIKNLSHRYATAWAVKDLNFTLDRKGVYGLLGSNGAGKSTTMNILSGVLNPTKGEVYINGKDLRNDPIEAKKNIGFLPQTAPLYLDLTVLEYLSYCAALRDVPGERISEAAAYVMSQCKLTHMKDRLLKNLSGGYRQRVGIAQAIIHRPALVILDEPSNGLDPMQIVEIRHLIRAIGEQHTVLISSHILSEIQLLCKQIIMIEQGKLVFADTMEAFTNHISPTSLLADFDNPPHPDELSVIKGVSRTEQLNAQTLRVYFDGQRSVSEQIIRKSVEKGWRLTQLTIEKRSIDEIFKELSGSTETR